MIPALSVVTLLLMGAIVLLVILSRDHTRIAEKYNSLVDDHTQLRSQIVEPQKLDRELVLRRVLEDFAENEYGYAKFALRIVYGKQK